MNHKIKINTMKKINLNIINDVLKKTGWPITRLAKEIGVSRRTLYNYIESPDNISLKTYQRLNEILEGGKHEYATGWLSAPGTGRY